jgi:VanZ family protein
MRGSIELNIRSLLEKTFLYGSMVWLMVRAGIRFTPAVILSAAFVLSLRIGQLFLPGRSAEITDPIIVLIVAGVMKALRENPALTAEFGE